MGLKSSINSFKKDTFIYFPAKIIEGIMGFVTIYVYTRLFPPSEFGVYSLIITGITLAVSIATGWLNHSAIRYYDSEPYKSYLTTMFFAWGTVNIVSILLAIVLIEFVPLISDNNFVKYSGLIVLLFIAYNTWGIIQSILRVMRKAITYSLLVSTIQIGRFALTAFLVMNYRFGIEAILVGLVTFDFIASIIALFKLNFFKNINIGSLSSTYLKKCLRYGIPLTGSAVISWILSVSDRYFIAYFKNNEQVGMYSIGYSIVSQPFQLIIASLMLSAFPIIIKTWNKDGKEKTEKLVTNIVQYLLMLIIPAVLGVTILKEKIFLVLADESYFEGNIILPWVAIGILFMGLTQYVNKVWELYQRTNAILYLTGLAALVNTVLNIIFIPMFGFVAASITTFIAYFTYFVISLYLTRKRFRFKLKSHSLIIILFSSLVMAGSLLLIKNYINSIVSLVVVIAAATVIYFTSLLLFKKLLKSKVTKLP